MKTSIRLFSWLAAVATSVVPAVAAPSCDTWNSMEFFIQATVTVHDVENCVQGGADPDARDENGMNPLHWAALWSDGNPEMIARLVELGADLNARNRNAVTPLHMAVGLDNPVMITRLVELGANPDARNENGSTPLHWAAFFNQSPRVIAELIEAGADPNARDKGEATPLHDAAYNANLDVIAELIQAGADVNARDDREGKTALHIAATKADNPDVITMLLDAGADGSARTYHGKSAWDLAQSNEALRGTRAWWLLNEFRFE